MLRVLIVDDETYVVDWLAALLENRKNPEADICRAYSAREALEWLNRAKIDLMITDIRMPEINGLTLISKARAIWPHCKVILLTAHAEFSYAYQAIEQEVAGYVLKTDEDAHILATVDKAVAQLEQEIRNLALLEQLQEHHADTQAAAKREVMLAVLGADGKRSAEMLPQFFSLFDAFLPDAPIFILVGRVDPVSAESDVLGRFERYGAVMKLAERSLGRHFVCACAEYAPHHLVWLLQALETVPEEDTRDTGERRHRVVIAGMLETVQRACAENHRFSVSFVLLGAPVKGLALPEGFRAAARQMRHRAADEAGFVFELRQADEGRLFNGIISFLHEYITQNITGDVSLVRLSEVSGYNASYLSRVYRQCTGETLSDYISRQKWNRIKALMSDPSLNIGDVAERAGFESRTYFNRFVKRITGIAPQEYRDQFWHR